MFVLFVVSLVSTDRSIVDISRESLVRITILSDLRRCECFVLHTQGPFKIPRVVLTEVCTTAVLQWHHSTSACCARIRACIYMQCGSYTCSKA